jgi:hypothetical protein
MTVPPIVLNLAGSLVAVLALAWLARWLGLGGDVRIRDADHARALAQDVLTVLTRLIRLSTRRASARSCGTAREDRW